MLVVNDTVVLVELLVELMEVEVLWVVEVELEVDDTEVLVEFEILVLDDVEDVVKEVLVE